MNIIPSPVYQKRLNIFLNEVSLYPVSCEKLADGRSDEQWLDAVLEGGAKIVQLRDKESSDGRLLAKARYFRKRTLEAGALFLINDRLDIALLSDADGVHVGQEDLPPAEIRKLAPEMIIGLSCNTEEQAQELGVLEQKGILPITYYNIGPLYSTGTKSGLRDFIGPESIARYCRHCSALFTVMGGIKLSHVEDVVAAGGQRIAVVTALTKSADITSETRKWIKAIAHAGAKQHG
ncbi:MAG: thiamine phosphate synthase [Desulfobulbaceae bacterium]|nr:thiamine phosphate synthase [Desulfobulbaceae bacterium]